MRYLLFLWLCMISYGTFAQNAAKTPTAVTAAFQRQYPGASPEWKADGKNYKAVFTDPKTRLGHIVVYDKEGNVVRSENEMDKLSSPGAINEYHSRNYPNEDYRIWSIEEKGGVSGYYSDHRSQKVQFDREGNSQPVEIPLAWSFHTLSTNF